MNQHLKNYLPIIYIILVFVVLIGLVFFICYFPWIYNWVYGNKILDKHIAEVIGNNTDDGVIAGKLMQWVHDNVHYPLIQESSFLFAGSDGWYKINNSFRIFLNSGPASWTIKTKLGRCGEDANYFVGVMTRLGYRVSKVEPEGPNHWDHAWAEYYAQDGTKIVLDPSSNQIITPNLHRWAENKSFTKIIAVDLKGNKVDVTREYQ